MAIYSVAEHCYHSQILLYSNILLGVKKLDSEIKVKKQLCALQNSFCVGQNE